MIGLWPWVAHLWTKTFQVGGKGEVCYHNMAMAPDYGRMGHTEARGHGWPYVCGIRSCAAIAQHNHNTPKIKIET